MSKGDYREFLGERVGVSGKTIGDEAAVPSEARRSL
jgi:hypothetical protein